MFFLAVLLTVGLILNETEAAVPTPTNFEYAQLSDQSNLLSWSWSNVNNVDPDRVSFFVSYCTETHCENTIVYETTVTVENLARHSLYKVKIFANVKHSNISDLINTSAPLHVEMETLETDWPTPNTIKCESEPENTTNSQISYLVSWLLPDNDNLKCITVIACERSLSNGPCVFENTDGYRLNVSIYLDYYKNYEVSAHAVYQLNLNQTAVRYLMGPRVFTGVGPSLPVSNLTVHQKDFSDLVNLSWQRPKVTNGPLDFYTIRVTDENATAIQPTERVLGLSNQTILIIRNAKVGVSYNFTVTPVNRVDQVRVIEGQTTAYTIILKGFGGFPIWAFILIGVLSLALFGGGAFCVATAWKECAQRKQNNRPKTTTEY